MRTVLIALTLCLIGIQSSAIQIQTGDNVTINLPVNEDLYIGGGTVVINAPVFGDLVVAGGSVMINDTISFDLIVTGGQIFIYGYVGDDIRSAGGQIDLSGNVGGDVVMAGGKIVIRKSTRIKGSLLVGGGEVSMDGTVEGQLKVAAGSFVLNGIVQKEADCRGGNVIINGQIVGKSILAASEIKLGSTAEFQDDVRYWNKSESLDFKQSLKKGQADFDSELQIESGRWHYLGFATVIALIGYLGAALTMIFILQYLFSDRFAKAATTVLNQSLKSVGMGLLFVITVPVAVIICMVSIVGLPVGLILLAVYLIVFMLATVITSVVAAHWLNNVYYGRQWKSTQLSLIAFALFVMIKLFSLTPFVGFPITALIICMAWGAIVVNIKWSKSSTVVV